MLVVRSSDGHQSVLHRPAASAEVSSACATELARREWVAETVELDDAERERCSRSGCFNRMRSGSLPELLLDLDPDEVSV